MCMLGLFQSLALLGRGHADWSVWCGAHVGWLFRGRGQWVPSREPGSHHPHLQFNMTVVFLGFPGLSKYFQYLLVDAYSRLQVRSPFQHVFGIEYLASIKVSAGRSPPFHPGAVTS